MTQTPIGLVRDRPFNQNLYLNLASRGYFQTTYFSDTAFSVENIKHVEKIVDENKKSKGCFEKSWNDIPVEGFAIFKIILLLEIHKL